MTVLETILICMITNWAMTATVILYFSMNKPKKKVKKNGVREMPISDSTGLPILSEEGEINGNDKTLG